MLTLFARSMLYAACAGLVVTPVAVQANTRASDRTAVWQGPAYSYAMSICAQQSSGCILPLPAEVAPPPPSPEAVAPAVVKKKKGWLPILLGAVVLLGGALALGGGGGGNESNGAN